MDDHIHVVSGRFLVSVDDEHQEWLASGEPCTLCGEQRAIILPNELSDWSYDVHTAREEEGR